MPRARLRPWRMAPVLVLLAIGPDPATGHAPPQAAPMAPWAAPTSLTDPRLEPLRRASATWEARIGPDRAVIDQVCLVPDLPTFLEVLATWDRGHWFPILFDDVESSFRFLRAFRPARVLRYPRHAGPIARDALWSRALGAVGASWSLGPGDRLPGDQVPRSIGPTPPGVVVSAPDAPMLAGAVALAAGRFQPLLRLETEKRFADLLSNDESRIFATDLALTIREAVPNCESLGDDGDFVTLAGDWPYRYRNARGEENAVDDRVCRTTRGVEQRWAFTGRILGDAAQSTYRAMCSLFLQPTSAVMFNGYDESSTPWSDYATRSPALRLSGLVPTSQVAGDRQGGIDGWHETFDPSNRHGLVFLNSHGSPMVFNLRGGPAGVADIPRGVPSAVLMIHSFSASDPTDPSTIAGRWLANGAFVYFGSMNEPYLTAFRTPRLVGDLLGERLPVVAAVRSSLVEPFGQPWRLVFLGDPMYRIDPRGQARPRLGTWEPTAGWPAYGESPRPAPGAEADLVAWVLKSALARLVSGHDEAPGDDLVDTILGIRRDRLPASIRPVHDALLVEVLLGAKRRAALRARIAAIPEGDRTPALRRSSETLAAIDLSLSLARGDAARARAGWSEIIRSNVTHEFKEQATARLGRIADSPVRRDDWALTLRLALRDRAKTPEADLIAAELGRVEAALRSGR